MTWQISAKSRAKFFRHLFWINHHPSHWKRMFFVDMPQPHEWIKDPSIYASIGSTMDVFPMLRFLSEKYFLEVVEIPTSLYIRVKLKGLFGDFSCIKRCRWRYCCQLTKYSLNFEKGLKYFACYTRVVIWPHTQLWSRENNFCDYSLCTYRFVLSLTQRWAVVCDHGGSLFQSKWRIYFSNKLMERFIWH